MNGSATPHFPDPMPHGQPPVAPTVPTQPPENYVATHGYVPHFPYSMPHGQPPVAPAVPIQPPKHYTATHGHVPQISQSNFYGSFPMLGAQQRTVRAQQVC
jgi:hypothetical protein